MKIHNEQRSRRTGERGAAMVEALVVIPFFMLILAGTVFVGGFYGRRIESQGLARYQAWKIAVADNCVATGTFENDLVNIVDSADLGELSKSPLAALCDKDFGSVSYTARASYAVTGPFPFSQNIMATAMAPCNETPIPGDVAYEASVQFLWDAYQSDGTIPADAAPPTPFPIALIFGPWGLYE